ncbi:MAG: hypothetical protein OEO21_01270 [Candidatus Krumholzibacteria bacterium]|nr:hypothetical protein [Candidatus Krumholzibacteria bacterium]
MLDNDTRGRRTSAAVALIVIGAVFFALQMTKGPAEVLVYLALGGLFLVGYLYRRQYNLLVPGCILLGLGLGALGERSSIDFRDFSQVGLGLGFIGIFVVDLAFRRRTHWWPLIPGGVLVLDSVADLRYVAWLFSKGWPLILVLIGLFMLLRRSRAADAERPPGQGEQG